MRFLLVRISLVLLLLAPAGYAEPFSGLAHEVSRVRSGDGADLTLFHFTGNENGPVILLEPGVVESAEMLGGYVEAFHKRGYDVYVGQVRLAGRGDTISGGGPRNGLQEVTLLDFPAHLREVIRRANGRPVHVFGHSMGGLEILAGFSDPKLAREFSPYVKGATVAGAPFELGNVPLWVRAQFHADLIAAKAAIRLVHSPTLNLHGSYFEVISRLRANGGFPARKAADLLEGAFLGIANEIMKLTMLRSDYTTATAQKRMWEEELSALPLETLRDFAVAAKRGIFLRRDGTALVVPEQITIPMQVVRAEKDMAVRWNNQGELFHRLGSTVKRLVDVMGGKHLDLVIADKSSASFMSSIIDFHDDPARATRVNPNPRFQSFPGDCEKALLATNPSCSDVACATE